MLDGGKLEVCHDSVCVITLLNNIFHPCEERGSSVPLCVQEKERRNEDELFHFHALAACDSTHNLPSNYISNSE